MSLSYENEIDSLISLMTLEEKVDMLHGNGTFTSAGVERLGIPEVNYTDGPLGVREEIERTSWSPVGLTTDSATFFPAGPGLSATWNVELAQRYGAAMGAEARARGKDVLLAPAMNIIRTPLGGRNYEYFSEDPFLNARIAVPMTIGIQNQDVAACLKHYAVNNQETNRGSVNVVVDERALREIYLPAFKAAVTEGNAYSVMGAYNKFRGAYVCESDYLLNDILKREWGFKGFVVSDWGAVHSTVGSAKSGLDVEMGTDGSFEDYYFARPLLDAVRAGKVSEKVINDKVRRILRVLYNCRFNDPARERGSINTPEISRVVYETASESVVLLKNTNGMAPLDQRQIKSLAVIGDNAVREHASGGFGAGVKARYETTPLEGLKAKLGDRVQIRFAQGYREQFLPGEEKKRKYLRAKDNRPDKTLIEEAVTAARQSDAAIIFAGSNRDVESESADRKDMQLPFGQVELIKEVIRANPQTIVVIIAGAPFDIVEVEKSASTILWSWFNGSEAGNALADIIFGNVNPSGKLPITMPVKLDHSPPHALDAFPGVDSVVYEEGLLVGYRWFDAKNVKPMYSFGYGLSYTTFEYSSLNVDKAYHRDDSLTAKIKIKNTGDRAGQEIVQLYVSRQNAQVYTPVKELKGFTKIRLEPGEEKEISITLNIADLAYFDAEKMEWAVEPGEYILSAGPSSANLPLTARIVVE